jgi:hypothetical protein
VNKIIATALLVIFGIGFISGNFFSIFTSNDVSYINIRGNSQNDAFDNYDNGEQPVSSEASNLLKFQELIKSEEIASKDKPSPHNWIKQNEILVYDNEVILRVDNPEWAIFTDTKSMDPVIDSTSKAIEIVPQSKEEIHVGDIVAYESVYKDGVIAHRVIDISEDKDGWYATLKGDNNDYPDPGKIRFSQIKRIVVAIIY